MPRTYRFVIGAAETGVRLDAYLTRHLPMTVSRAMIQRNIRAGQVRVGEQPAKVHQRLRRGDVVSARFDELGARSRGLDLIPQEIPLEIVHEDADVLVVNKPAGLVTHPAPGHWDGTLVNAILWHLEQGQGVRDRGVARAGIVHRLDKDTSGLLLVAKTETAHLVLARQMKARTIHRRYLALVEGHPPLDTGTIDVPIGRHSIRRKEMAIRHLGGRSAVTHYRVLQRYDTGARHKRHAARHKKSQPGANSVWPEGYPYALVEVSLETGRTHQIRVHMAHAGYPVVGEPTYSRRPPGFWRDTGVTRQLLHAYRLRFQHPTTHRQVTVAAPVPEDMSRWIEQESLERIANF